MPHQWRFSRVVEEKKMEINSLVPLLPHQRPIIPDVQLPQVQLLESHNLIPSPGLDAASLHHPALVRGKPWGHVAMSGHLLMFQNIQKHHLEYPPGI